MGQKADPIGLRLGINKTWQSSWFSKTHYAQFVQEDIKIRAFVEKNLQNAGISKIAIERPQKTPIVKVYCARPGVIIGKKGAGVEQFLAKMKKTIQVDCSFNIVEVRKPELQAHFVAKDICQQMERRVFYKRAMRKAMQSALKMGAKGVRVSCSGRLGGVEIARTEWYFEGRVPLHSLRADIDFSSNTAHTTSGACGVKVWIYRGDVLGGGVSEDVGDIHNKMVKNA
jgi:small subunit ribosomal protein S3